MGIVEIIDLEDILDDAMYDIGALLNDSQYFASTNQKEAVLQDKIALSFYLLQLGYVDAVICGATVTTAHVIQMALRILDKKDGIRRISSAFIMKKDNHKIIFADCAVNMHPGPEELRDIAILAADTAKNVGMMPHIGLLSFVTGASDYEGVQKTMQVKKLIKESKNELLVTGPVQFDAAIDVKILNEKMGQCGGDVVPVNTFIFPDLASGNIGYKIAQRLGGYQAVGPIVQGFKREVYDLPRGCSEQDIVSIAQFYADLG